MSKKPGKFAAVYRKTSKEFKDRGKGDDPMKPGWVEAETDYLVKNAGPGKVSYPHGEGKDAYPENAVDGTAHITKKGKVVKK